MEMARTKSTPRKTEEATRLLEATAPFRCTYCDEHYNHRQSLRRHLKKIQSANSHHEATAALVRTLELNQHVSLALKLTDYRYSLAFLQLAFCRWLLRRAKNPHVCILHQPFAKLRKLDYKMRKLHSLFLSHFIHSTFELSHFRKI